MKDIGLYKELIESFDPELAQGYPSMVDNFSNDPYSDKNTIIHYLLNGGRDCVITGAKAIDVFTGRPTKLFDNGRDDGVYEWDVSLAHYVEEYNLRLPEDFVKHILDQQKKAA